MQIRWCWGLAIALGGCGLFNAPQATVAQPSPTLNKFFESLKSFETGGAIDFDGDGAPDNTVTVNGNVTVFTDLVNRITITFTGDDTVDATADLNMDDRLDYTFHGQRVGDVATEDESQDTDFDGTDDRKVHRVFTNGTPVTLDETVQTLETPDGGTTAMFVVTASRSGPASDDSGRNQDNCDGQAGFPDESGRTISPTVPNVNVTVVANGKPGACTDQQANNILSMLYPAIDDLKDCLGRINPTLRDRLAKHLKDGKLVIGCGNTCPGTAISTELPGRFWNWFHGEQHMNIDYALATQGYSGGLPTTGDLNVLTEYLTHELTHYAGEDHPDQANEKAGHDLPYGCGRLCNHCLTTASNGGVGTPAGFNADCARCADAARKTQCGAYVQVDGAGDCVNATAGSAVICTNQPLCGVCEYHHPYACDDERTGDPRPEVECCVDNGCASTNYPCTHQIGEKYNNTCTDHINVFCK